LMSDLSEKKKPRFVKIKLVGAKSNRDGLGAIVKVTSGGTTQVRQHDGKSGYLSQSALPLYFGLGEAQTIDRVEISWPSGKKQTLAEDISIDTLLTVVEPAD